LPPVSVGGRRHVGIQAWGQTILRKLLLLVLAGLMLMGGLYVAVFGHRFFVAAILVALAGAYLIWTDIIAPRFGIKTWED